jgi:hypothetical protein
MRVINDQSILEFKLLLSYENWEDTFMDEDDVNISFNKFLNIFLRIFQSCFIKKCINPNRVSKPWITKGIKAPCNRKRELYLKAIPEGIITKWNISYMINNIAKYYLKF